MSRSFEEQIKTQICKAIFPKIQAALEEVVHEKLFRDFDVSILKPPSEAGNMSFALVESIDVSREIGRLTSSSSIIDRIVGMYIDGLMRKDGKKFRLTEKERELLIRKIKEKLE